MQTFCCGHPAVKRAAMEPCNGRVQGAAAARLTVDKRRWATESTMEFFSVSAPEFFARVRITPAGMAELVATGSVTVSDGRITVAGLLDGPSRPRPEHGDCSSVYDGTVAVVTALDGGAVRVRMDAETALEFWAESVVW